MQERAKLDVKDGDRVDPAQVGSALTTSVVNYTDGSTQTFTPDGRTTYTEHEHTTDGEWGVAHGQFWSFWPPSYRATYELHWIVEADEVVGIRFTDTERGSRFDGRFR